MGAAAFKRARFQIGRFFSLLPFVQPAIKLTRMVNYNLTGKHETTTKKKRRYNEQSINIKTTTLEQAASKFETTWFLIKLSILDDNRAPV